MTRCPRIIWGMIVIMSCASCICCCMLRPAWALAASACATPAP
jgi:hypothetical protein